MKITWAAHSNSSFLATSREAPSIKSAVLQGRAYVMSELMGEGIVAIFVDGEIVRQDERSIYTNFRWQRRILGNLES